MLNQVQHDVHKGVQMNKNFLRTILATFFTLSLIASSCYAVWPFGSLIYASQLDPADAQEDLRSVFAAPTEQELADDFEHLTIRSEEKPEDEQEEMGEAQNLEEYQPENDAEREPEQESDDEDDEDEIITEDPYLLLKDANNELCCLVAFTQYNASFEIKNHVILGEKLYQSPLDEHLFAMLLGYQYDDTTKKYKTITLRIYNAQKGSFIRTRQIKSKEPQGIMWSQDGKHICILNSGQAEKISVNR